MCGANAYSQRLLTKWRALRACRALLLCRAPRTCRTAYGTRAGIRRAFDDVLMPLPVDVVFHVD